MQTCAFDTLFMRNVPHILEKIFFSLDFVSFCNCLVVSISWKNVLLSESFLKMGRHMFHREIEASQWELFVAAENGRIDVLRRLLSVKILDIDCLRKVPDGLAHIRTMTEHMVSCDFVTPLQHAIRYRQKEAVELIIEKGADVNKSTRWGWTPLHFAAWHNQTSIVQLLLDRGANPNIPNAEGKLPCTWQHSSISSTCFTFYGKEEQTSHFKNK